jgi:hypothetical protein
MVNNTYSYEYFHIAAYIMIKTVSIVENPRKYAKNMELF